MAVRMRDSQSRTGMSRRKKRIAVSRHQAIFMSPPEAGMTSELPHDDYVLGTRDDEVARLLLQHRVWRPRALDAWRRAGFTTGDTIIDVGAGPGHASVDLAQIVGPAGR